MSDRGVDSTLSTSRALHVAPDTTSAVIDPAVTTEVYYLAALALPAPAHRRERGREEREYLHLRPRKMNTEVILPATPDLAGARGVGGRGARQKKCPRTDSSRRLLRIAFFFANEFCPLEEVVAYYRTKDFDVASSLMLLPQE